MPKRQPRIERIHITPEWAEIVDIDTIRPHPKNPRLRDEERKV